jgi:hypothetical protein
MTEILLKCGIKHKIFKKIRNRQFTVADNIGNKTQSEDKHKKSPAKKTSQKNKEISNTDPTKNSEVNSYDREGKAVPVSYQIPIVLRSLNMFYFWLNMKFKSLPAGSRLYSHHNWLFCIVVLRHTHIHSVNLSSCIS